MRVLGYIFSFLLLIGCGASIGAGGFSGGAAIGIVIALIILYRLNRGKKKALKLKWDAKSGNEELDKLNAEVFEKALDDYNSIERERRALQDKEMNAQLAKMQKIAANFLRYLQAHPEKVGLARRFVDYYQDRALLLLRKFLELEKTELHSPEVQQTKEKIKEVLDSFDEAYEDQFSKVLNAQMMDLDAELKVMKQTLESDGIETEEPPQLKEGDKKSNMYTPTWAEILKDTASLFLDNNNRKKK